jgi:hypothetical protein
LRAIPTSELKVVPTRGGLHGEELARWDTDDGFVRATLALLGINGAVGEPLRCILPGHEPTPGSASLWRDTHDRVVYRDHHRADGYGSFTLAEIFAAYISGETRRIRGSEHAVWKRRLLARTGQIGLSNIPVAVQSVHPPKMAAAVLTGFTELVAVRRLTDPADMSFPFSYRFAARWCGLTVDQAKAGLRWLVTAKVLVVTGALAGRGGLSGAKLYALASEATV